MKDIFGQTLEVGDRVAFNPPYYQGLVHARVEGFAPQKVRLAYSHQGRPCLTTAWPFDCAKRP